MKPVTVTTTNVVNGGINAGGLIFGVGYYF